MRRSLILLAVTAFLVMTTAALAGAEKPQTVCPVSGKTINKATSPHIDWQGQRIYFDSQDSRATFKADPEKYFTKAATEGVVFENIQTVCPVSGEKLGGMGKPTYRDYKGRRVMFCCGSCKKTFDQNADNYLAKLPGEQPAK
ncbi:MAG TPA: YHS domain-containing protein [Thermoanaerobaculaceae bacterium]|nr:YHS domain-containing protein [Thermoanaerobaculaceae bacterium]HPS78785.1 YHS domain-containing protein [Thermoanaerobaculaceae bacterium]